ncbi:hypothetical protein [Terrabacter sp. MAHUQ-38]|uniref:hypothetical protein n=1 Tax=unclassified Terrabacter TaxID=2630222 RepID=UPI00165DE1B6|nr:hypothetical protein [Terrabacter sp. MAHUQ-38]MBC9819858.1 hypothetical protein [Terrabacter sp. MAHUQ-38]
MSTPLTPPAGRAVPITRFVPVAPDADYETIRSRLLARLAVAAPEWTDHNAPDPGVTLAEATAYGLADLHYRVSERALDDWPLEARAWADDPGRHWHATLPVGRWDAEIDPSDPAVPARDLAPVSSVADALAQPGTSAALLEPLVRDSRSRADAIALLSAEPWASALRPVDRPAVVALLRARLVRQVAQEQADVIAGAVAGAHADAVAAAPRRSDPDAPLDVVAIDAAAAAELAWSLPLWDEEVVALVRRERHRRSREALRARLDVVRATTSDTLVATRAELALAGLDTDEARLAVAAAPQAAGLLPEDLEDPQGRSVVWPPHPVQALTCEPVTADDYARRARTHAGVSRAWTVRGRLTGIAWNGLPTGTLASIPVDPTAEALTLVVESRETLAASARDAFLRDVLATAIGPEVTAPFPDWRDDVDDLEPRRVICDEVGASLLERAPVLVQATLVTDVGVDRDAVVEDARARITAFFARGRPETFVPPPPQVVDGPWPRVDQPTLGWVPGEPVRFTEVVEAIVGNPAVWGVEDLAMKVEGAAAFVTASDGPLVIPANAVPTLADARCLRVRFSLTSRCGDA